MDRTRPVAEPLDGFLLAAGLGLRMGPLSQCLPKPAWTLQGRPLLQWGAGALRAHGIRRIGCNAHLHADRLCAVADGLEVFEEPQLPGSAGGLLHARGRVASELITWNADVWAEAVPFDRLRDGHRETSATLSWLLVAHPGGPWNPVWMDDQGRVLPKGQAGTKGPTISRVPRPGRPRPLPSFLKAQAKWMTCASACHSTWAWWSNPSLGARWAPPRLSSRLPLSWPQIRKAACRAATSTPPHAPGAGSLAVSLAQVPRLRRPSPMSTPSGSRKAATKCGWA